MTLRQHPFCPLRALALWAILTPGSALAGQFFEPSALGMGGAVRTLGGDTSTMRLNASALAAVPTYRTSMAYAFYGLEHGHRFSTSAYDSKTNSLVLGTSYSFRSWEPPFAPQLDVNWYPVEDQDSVRDKRTFHRWDIAVAYGFLERRLNVGLTVRVLKHDYALHENKARFTMDAGFTAWPLDFVGAHVAVQNFIPTKDADIGQYDPFRLTAGAALRLAPVFKLEGDVVFDFTDTTAPYVDMHVGGEISIFEVVKVRAGYYSERKFLDNYITWGVGVGTQKVALAFAMRVEAGKLDKRIRTDNPEANNRFLNTIGIEVAF